MLLGRNTQLVVEGVMPDLQGEGGGRVGNKQVATAALKYT